jgi:hypothetical protein
MWDVWKVYYMTYAEIAKYGDKPRELIAQRITFEKARELVDRLGFDYSMHPSA